MNEKTFKGRVVQKHETEENWAKSSFVPKQAEIVVYDIDDNYSYERFKIGDGVTNVNDLPFTVLQSDWNENDESSYAYIQNRPFYESVTEDNFTKTTTLGSYIATNRIETGSNTIFLYDMNTQFGVSDLSSINPCTVTWAGTEYECELKESDGNVPSEYIGNAKYYGGEDTGEPFIIYYYDGSLVLGEYDDSSSSRSVTITSNKKNITLVQLDEKYIPDTIARKEYVDESLSNINFVVNIEGKDVDGTWTYFADKTFSEIVTAINNGKNVTVDFSSNRYHLSGIWSSGKRLEFSFPYISGINTFFIDNDETITHNSDYYVDYLQPKDESSLNTTDKTIAGAINELLATITDLQTEVAELKATYVDLTEDDANALVEEVFG